jgi:hypothetical protein
MDMNHDEQIKQWIQEAGTEKPGIDFAGLVMAKIEKAPSPAIEYKPVISPTGIRIIIGGIILLFLAVILTTSGQDVASTASWLTSYNALLSDISQWSLPSWGKPTYELPSTGLSPIYGYSLFTAALAFIILARTWDRKMSW